MVQGSGSLNFPKNFRKMSLKSSLKLQLFRVCIPYFFALRVLIPYLYQFLGGFLTVMYTYIDQWVLICLSLLVRMNIFPVDKTFPGLGE